MYMVQRVVVDGCADPNVKPSAEPEFFIPAEFDELEEFTGFTEFTELPEVLG